MASIDAPSWTFGLKLNTPTALVPGPGSYEVGGTLIADSAGTVFGRRSEAYDRARLVFEEAEARTLYPGPGAYETGNKRRRRHSARAPDGGCGTPRFAESGLATDAGPGAYLPADFAGKTPAFSIPARAKEPAAKPEGPGPGEYIEVQLGASHGSEASGAGFGRQSSPRFAQADQESTPGPGAYQNSHFEPRTGKEITFGRRFRRTGWSTKIKEMELPWEVDERGGTPCVQPRSHAPLRREHSRKSGVWSCPRRRGRPSSAPPSSRLRRACARGRRLCEPDSTASRTSVLGGPSTAELFQEAGRQKRIRAEAQSHGTHRHGTAGTGDGAPRLFGTALQRPPDAPVSPGPSTYQARNLDEFARAGKICGIGSKSGRHLFRPPPDTPGPASYAAEVIQGPTTQGFRRGNGARAYARVRARSASSTNVCRSPTGTFGSTERFPRDTELRPGVGEYDLETAERVSNASAMTLGRRPTGVPYEPRLNRYLRSDNRNNPSPHDYRPESARGSAGECGIGGHAPAPPAWSFGRKRTPSRPPPGPGPGRFRPLYEPAPPAATFGIGRELTSGCMSRVPWTEAEERAARGEGGGENAKLYRPARTRVGAKVFMTSRRLPRPAPRTRGRT